MILYLYIGFTINVVAFLIYMLYTQRQELTRFNNTIDTLTRDLFAVEQLLAEERSSDPGWRAYNALQEGTFEIEENFAMDLLTAQEKAEAAEKALAKLRVEFLTLQETHNLLAEQFQNE